MLLTDEEMFLLTADKAKRKLLKQFPNTAKCGEDYHTIAKAQLKKVVEGIEDKVFYVDASGYIALKPNATKNWQSLLKEIKEEE